MQPKNVIERKKSFFNFLLLFVLSTAVIVLLSFFSTRVPLTHNELLQKEVEVSDHEKEFSKHFMSQMTGVMSMLDTIDTKVINADLLDGQISTGITKLSGMVENDSVYNKDLYRSIVLNLSDLQRAKQQLRKETAAGTDINQFKKDNESLSNQLSDCKTQNTNLQMQLIQALSQKPH